MSATLPHRIKPHVRWMIRRDMPEVVSSELAGTPAPWAKDDFARIFRHRNVIGLVAEYRDTVVGHAVYRLERRSIVVLRLAVDVDFRRIGVGTALMTKLIAKLSPDSRPHLVVEAPDACLDAHLFLRALGLHATAVVRDDDGDLYRFVAFCEPPPSDAQAGALIDCGGEGVGRG